MSAVTSWLADAEAALAKNRELAAAKRARGEPLDENERHLLGLSPANPGDDAYDMPGWKDGRPIDDPPEMPPDEFFGDVDELPNGPDDAPAPPWVARVAACEVAWFTEAPPRRSWLLRDERAEGAGVLPTGKVGMLLATSGIGKTMVACQLAISVASAEPINFLGCYSVPNAGRVLLVLGEEDDEEVRRRLYNARRAVGACVPEPGSIVALPLAGVACALIEADDRGNPTETTFLRWLRAFVKDEGPFALVIVDPLSRFAGLDAEKDNAAATRVIQAAESIAAETGAVVLIVHHTNKLSRTSGGAITAESSRGASAFVDGSRWAAALTVEKVDDVPGLDELVTFAVVKSNYSRKGAPVTLRRDLDNSGALVPMTEADREIVSRARDAANPTTKRREAQDEARKKKDDEKAARKAAALANAEAREAAEDAVLAALLATEPNASKRRMRIALGTAPELKPFGGCGHDRADRAIARGGVVCP